LLPAKCLPAFYDADMDVMQPNRHTMVRIALETLPFNLAAARRFCLEIGLAQAPGLAPALSPRTLRCWARRTEVYREHEACRYKSSAMATRRGSRDEA
jgi:hypothetical protein